MSGTCYQSCAVVFDPAGPGNASSCTRSAMLARWPKWWKDPDPEDPDPDATKDPDPNGENPPPPPPPADSPCPAGTYKAGASPTRVTCVGDWYWSDAVMVKMSIKHHPCYTEHSFPTLRLHVCAFVCFCAFVRMCAAVSSSP